MIKFLLPLVALAALLSGCTNVAVRKVPTVELSRYHRVFVVQPFNENRHVDEMLVNELRRHGYEASSGPLTMLPDNADAILSYSARWTGDFGTYLTDLSVQLRTAHTNKPLAEGHYSQPLPRPKPADVVISRLVERLVKQ